MSQFWLGHQDALSMVEVYLACGGLERLGDEKCRADALDDGSVGGAVYLGGWMVFCRAMFGFFVG